MCDLVSDLVICNHRKEHEVVHDTGCPPVHWLCSIDSLLFLQGIVALCVLLSAFHIPRDEKFGGDITFTTYEDLEMAFVKQVHTPFLYYDINTLACILPFGEQICTALSFGHIAKYHYISNKCCSCILTCVQEV